MLLTGSHTGQAALTSLMVDFKVPSELGEETQTRKKEKLEHIWQGQAEPYLVGCGSSPGPSSLLHPHGRSSGLSVARTFSKSSVTSPLDIEGRIGPFTLRPPKSLKPLSYSLQCTAA